MRKSAHKMLTSFAVRYSFNHFLKVNKEQTYQLSSNRLNSSQLAVQMNADIQ